MDYSVLNCMLYIVNAKPALYVITACRVAYKILFEVGECGALRCLGACRPPRNFENTSEVNSGGLFWGCLFSFKMRSGVKLVCLFLCARVSKTCVLLDFDLCFLKYLYGLT